MTNQQPDTQKEQSSDSDSQGVRVVLDLPDRDQLLELFSAVSEHDLSVQTKHLSKRTETRQQTTVDLDALTDKQLRTLEIALDVGYYEQPRNATLADLADQLGISKSAVSQRLRSAEAKLVKGIFDKHE